jgi:two-component system chemotaxis family response regulator WspR
MPGANGLDLVMAYRSTPGLHNVPIVVLSSNEQPDMKRAAFAIGANDYLVKPPEPIELVARVRYHSRSYLSLVRLDAAYRAIRESQAQLLKSNTDLQRLHNSDGLTGLPNRRYFNEYLGQAWEQSTKDVTPLSLLMIDVDHFKRYNDRFGHLAGDDALQKVAGAIRARLDDASSLGARFGGEEFSVVLPRCDAAQARQIGEHIRRQVEATALDDAASPERGLTVSIGVATMVATAQQMATDLIAAADSRLYRAKRDGRNRVVDA